MQCKCGKELTYSCHKVTENYAKERWINPIPDTPLLIEQWNCDICSRNRHKVYEFVGKGKQGKLLKVHG